MRRDLREGKRTVSVRRTQCLLIGLNDEMVAGWSLVRDRDGLVVHPGVQAGRGFQFQGNSSVSISFWQVGIRRITSVSQAAGSSRYRRAVISRP